jgi:hypothetical protein
MLRHTNDVPHEAMQGPLTEAELESVQIVLHGADAEMEDLGNLLAALVGAEQADDLTLSRSQEWLRLGIVRAGHAKAAANDCCGMSAADAPPRRSARFVRGAARQDNQGEQALPCRAHLAAFLRVGPSREGIGGAAPAPRRAPGYSQAPCRSRDTTRAGEGKERRNHGNELSFTLGQQYAPMDTGVSPDEAGSQ